MTDDKTVQAPPPSSRGQNRELWVGLFVILGVGLTMTLLFTLTDAAMFRGRYIVTTHLQNAGGLRKGDPVQMRGVNIGRVQRFSISNDDVALRLEIEGEYTIPSDSKVELVSASLLGGMVARVIPGTAADNVRGGSTLQGSMPPQITDQAKNIADQTTKVLARAQALLSDKTVDGVEASAQELHGLLKELSATTAEQRKELLALTTSLRAASANIDKATSGPELERAIKRLDAISEKADVSVQSLQRGSHSLEEVMGRMDRGEGTLGKLSKDDALYTSINKTVDSLNGASADLRELLQDLKKNPKRYVKLSLF
jgi:phospholipid/cholesterol/gamma-HCH transport system substrate-binding protein